MKMDSCDKVSVTPSSCKDIANKCINKTLLTPCRSVGLKRKSSSLIKSSRTIDSPTVLTKCTPNSVTSRKYLGSSCIRDKLKKRKLDLSLEGYNSVENSSCSGDLNGEGVQVDKNKTDSVACSSIKSSQKYEQDNNSFKIIDKTSNRNNSLPSEITNDMILDLVANIRKKELKLRSLDETSVYAKKHNPKELKELIIKWKLGCQDALREIQTLINGKGFSMSMAQVLGQFQVPHTMVNFNVDCDEFED